MITIHITDDHKMLVEGLTATVNGSGIAMVTGISYTLAECREALSSQVPDLLLLDLNLPDGNGIDFCAEVKLTYPAVKIIVLTSRDEYSIVRRVLDNGASGYILKNSVSEEVIAGISTVMNGGTFLCDGTDMLMRGHTEQPVWLSTRERELLRLLVDGCTNQEIAGKLFLSVETVKTYRKNMLAKLGAKNSMMLVKMAIEKSLI